MRLCRGVLKSGRRLVFSPYYGIFTQNKMGMPETIVWFLILLAGVVVGVFTGMYVQKLKLRSWETVFKERETDLRNVVGQLQATLDTELESKEVLRGEKERLMVELTNKEADLRYLHQKNVAQKEEVEALQKRFTLEFENLANRIFNEKSEKFTLQNKENIQAILTPLQDKIQQFERKVEDSQKENIGIHAALKEQLFQLQQQNLKITQEAENLAKALKGDSKTQGNWGELVLERVLEKSGLEKGREYEVQQSFIREDGARMAPDVVIYLPDRKKMIIDAKVSLTAYERYVNAEEAEREGFLKEHLHSIKRHIEQLSEKRYQDLYEMEAPDFVLMFIPVEPAFAVAINYDNTLYIKAFEKNIVIVTPATLLATLRTVDAMWINEKQQRNALEIAKQAGALYDKFEGFITDLTKVGRKMDEAKEEYKNAMGKLHTGGRNIIVSIEKLRKMGAKAKKSIPEAVLKRAENEGSEG